MVNSIRADRNIPIKMRDGVILRADIYRPDDNEKHPAIVVRTPYDKILSEHSDYLSSLHAAFAGYAFVVQDLRGRFASEGEFKPMSSEGPDGYDTIETVAAEPWCDGNVGMVGSSYLGRNQWQAAIENPPHLKAIAPSVISAGPISDTRRTGVMDLEQSISWFAAMAVDMLTKLKKEGKDVTEAAKMVERARFNLNDIYNYLPLKEVPHFNFEGLSEGFMARMSNDLPPTVKTEKDLLWPFEKVQVPCFHNGGWYDLFAGGLFTAFEGMRERGGTDLARKNQFVLCGPWSHGSILPAYVGAINFGPAANSFATFTMDRHITFFDRYLRGIEGRPMPAVRYFVMGKNRWKNADTWPLPETQWQRYYLHSKGRANSLNGDGLLSTKAPQTEQPDVYIYDPRFPVPTIGGRNLLAGTLVSGPFDQRANEQRNDVLCFTTPELTEELEVTGPLKLHLYASTSVRDTDFMAKLIDVYPDGTAYNVAEGCIRARFRKGLLHEEFIVPGAVNEYIIDLAQTSIVFGIGHRIRVDITSSNFPRIDRNMNTGNPFGEDAAGIPAVQTIFHEKDYASYIDLPVIPSRWQIW
ncbi:MAG: CocE/NonD family hydrolase [Deltaproteobacteria bacterium]|nr:CocE/NonD family hydrolase [Deltaproteobacteria bacterium]